MAAEKTGPRCRRYRLLGLLGLLWLPALALAAPGPPAAAAAEGLRLEQIQLLFEPAAGQIRVREIHTLRNPGEPRRLEHGLPGALFPGAHQLRIERVPAGMMAQPRVPFEVRGPLPGGRSQLRFEYLVPANARLERVASYPVERLVVVATGRGARLTGAIFRRFRRVAGRTASHRTAVAGPIAAGGRIAMELSFPAQVVTRAEQKATGMGAGSRLVRDWRVVATWMVPLVLLAIFFFGIRLATHPATDPPDAMNRAALQRERERLLEALAASTLRVGPGEGQATRREREITRRLANVYRLLDDLRSPR